MSAHPVAIPLLLALAAPLARAGAQQDADSARLAFVRIPEGTLVRATLRATAVERGVPLVREARLVWQRDDSVRLAWTRQLDARTLAWRELAALDTAAGHEGPGPAIRRGALVGGGVGFATGAFFTLLATAMCESGRDCVTRRQLVGTGLLTALGAGVGAGIGSTFTGRVRWARVETLPPRTVPRTIAPATRPAPVPLAAGTRVRVQLAGEASPRRGTVRWATADSLAAGWHPSGAATPVPWSSVLALDTLARRSAGAGVGTLVATIFATASLAGASELLIDPGTPGIVSGGLLLGVLAGPFVGKVLPGESRWCRVAAVGTEGTGGCEPSR